MLNVIGQFGPLVGTHLYPESDGPYYVKGMSVCAVFMAAVGALSLGLRFILAAKNRNSSVIYERLADEDGRLVAEQRKSRQATFEFIL